MPRRDNSDLDAILRELIAQAGNARRTGVRTIVTHGIAWAMHALTAASWSGLLPGLASSTDRHETLAMSAIALLVQAFHRGGPPANGSGTSPFPLLDFLRRHYPDRERCPASSGGASGAAGRAAGT